LEPSRELTPLTGEGCPPKLAVDSGERRWTAFSRKQPRVPNHLSSINSQTFVSRPLQLQFPISRPVRMTPPEPRVIQRGKMLARCGLMSKRFVYVLKNGEEPPRYYTGITSDVARRHAEHNAGSCTHTAKHCPWSVDVVIEFADERRAVAFERYLKSGSGVAFANRHLR